MVADYAPQSIKLYATSRQANLGNISFSMSLAEDIHEEEEVSLIPEQIIFQPELKTTIVKWEDGTITTVKCSDEETFVPEVGVAMALVKKVFPNRSEFLRMVNSAYVQPVRKKKKEVAPSTGKKVTPEDIAKAIKVISSL